MVDDQLGGGLTQRVGPWPLDRKVRHCRDMAEKGIMSAGVMARIALREVCVGLIQTSPGLAIREHENPIICAPSQKNCRYSRNRGLAHNPSLGLVHHCYSSELLQ